jgi:hypothetical protein
MAGTTDRVLQLLVLRQVRRRAFNERLSRLDDGRSDEQARLYRCECGLIGCAATIRLSADEYASIRAHPRRFAVCVDHVIAEAEDLVATRRGHAVVEQRAGTPVPPTTLVARSVSR